MLSKKDPILALINLLHLLGGLGIDTRQIYLSSRDSIERFKGYAR
jgi:hypothetical protein